MCLLFTFLFYYFLIYWLRIFVYSFPHTGLLVYRCIYFVDFIIYSFIYWFILPTLYILSRNLFIYSCNYTNYFTYILYSFIYLLYLQICIYFYLWLIVTTASFAPNIWPERRIIIWLLNDELKRMWKEIFVAELD
jgi:hypothetical protein